MLQETQISSRQLRMLVVLLLLLPLLPTAIMARFMWHTLEEGRLDGVESIRRVYQAQLHRVSTNVRKQFKEGVFGKGADVVTAAPRILAAYEGVFADTQGIRITDPGGRIVAETGSMAGEASVTATAGEVRAGEFDWKVELFGVEKQINREVPEDENLRALVTPFAVAGVVFVVAALVAYAVTRQLRIEELKTDFFTTVGHELKTPLASYDLLEYLAVNPGRALSRETILNAVWGYDGMVTGRSVDRFVTTLRKKIETDPREPRHILTVRGFGYKFGSEGG